MKQWTILTFCLILLFSLSFSVAARDYRVTDDADLLTSGEEEALEEEISRIIAKYSEDIAIHTIDSLGGKSITEYADDYFDQAGYGIGEDSSGLILVICMGERNIYISTSGACGYAIDDYEVEEILDAVYEEATEGNFYDACEAFLWRAEDFLQEEAELGNSGYENYDKDREYYFGSDREKAKFGFGNFVISLLIGLAGGGVGLLFMRSGMNTAVAQKNAQNYVANDSYHLTTNQNTFLYSNTNRVRRSSSENSSGHSGGSAHRAGGAMHRSSSGRIHGGGGRKF